MSEKLFKPDGEHAYELLRRTRPSGNDYVIAWRLAEHCPYVVWLVAENGGCSGGRYCDNIIQAVEVFIKAIRAERSTWLESQLRNEALAAQDKITSGPDEEMENTPCAPAGQYCPKCDDVHCSSVDGHKWNGNLYCTECGADGAG